MTPNTICGTIRRLDINKMQRHCVINHHVNGLDYLCLHRSDDLTVKVYIMEEPKNDNSGLLVNPHSHRYAFSTCVLNGAIDHILYKKVSGNDWEEHQYDPDEKMATVLGPCSLVPSSMCYGYRSEYWCDAHFIHSIKCRTDCGPLVMTLTQLRDDRRFNELYLPNGSNGQYTKPDSHIPSIQEMRELMDRILFYTGRHFNVFDRKNPNLYGNGVRAYQRGVRAQQDKS